MDHQPFENLVKTHLNMVYWTCHRQLHDHAMADDATQAVFILLHKKVESLLGRTNIAAWLYNTARYTCSNTRRYHQRRTRHEREAAAMKSEVIETPGETWRELQPLLDRAMQQLKSAERSAVVMKFFEDKSFGQIASELGGTEVAARQRVFRAVGKLRDYFRHHGSNLSEEAVATALPFAVAQAPISSNTIVSRAIGSSGSVAAEIAHGANRMLLLFKVKTLATAAAVVLGAGGVGTWIATTALSTATTAPAAMASQPAAPATAPAPTAAAREPIATLRDVVSAIRREDMAAMQLCFAWSNESERQLIQPALVMAFAEHEVKKAMLEKNIAMTPDHHPGSRYSFLEDDLQKGMLDRSEKGVVKVQGDTAILQFDPLARADGKGMPPDRLQFRRINGDWRLDLIAMWRLKTAEGPERLARCQRGTKVLREIATDIATDQIRTSEELGQALMERMGEANSPNGRTKSPAPTSKDPVSPGAR